jgi:hypothetical protein
MTDTWDWPSINNAQLARYVTPNRAVAALGFTPAVPDQTANDLLKSGEHSTLVSRIYEDLVARKISYSLEPVVASTIVQRIGRRNRCSDQRHDREKEPASILRSCWRDYANIAGCDL